jgi:hypothetical protein
MKELGVSVDVIVGVARIVPLSLVVIVVLPVALAASIAPRSVRTSALRALQELTRLATAVGGRGGSVVEQNPRRVGRRRTRN